MSGMLERYAADRGAELWRWRWRRVGPAVVLTVVLHAGLLVALVIAAMWDIEKLEMDGGPVFLSIGTATPLPEAAAAPPPAGKPKAARRRPRHVRTLAQPEHSLPAAIVPVRQVAEVVPEEAQVGERGAEGLKLFGSCEANGECMPRGLGLLAEGECGNGVVEPGEQCDDGGRGNGDGCSARCAIERPITVDNRIIEGYRIGGDAQIHAPESVREQMAEHGQTRTLGAVEMCLRDDGDVVSLRLLRSTGYAEYDKVLMSRMRGWRYRPYRLADGTRVAACTVVTFIYQMQIRVHSMARAGTR